MKTHILLPRKGIIYEMYTKCFKGSILLAGKVTRNILLNKIPMQWWLHHFELLVKERTEVTKQRETCLASCLSTKYRWCSHIAHDTINFVCTVKRNQGTTELEASSLLGRFDSLKFSNKVKSLVFSALQESDHLLT